MVHLHIEEGRYVCQLPWPALMRHAVAILGVTCESCRCVSTQKTMLREQFGSQVTV